MAEKQLPKIDDPNLPGPSTRVIGSVDYFESSMSMQSIKQQIDIESIASKSMTVLSTPHTMEKSRSHVVLTQFVKVLEDKALTAQNKIQDNYESEDKIIHTLDVLDYFAAKDGLKYIGFLEQLQYNYDNKCKAEVYDTSQAIRDEVEKARQKIQAISEYHYHHSSKEMHEFDFPVITEQILHHFPIDASRKLHEIAKYHNYGIKMVLHWVYIIQRRTRDLNADRVEAFAIELLADIMVPSYAVFIHFAEFIICMADAPIAIKEGYPLEDLLGYLRRFYEALWSECNAIAESVGEVMVRIPDIKRETVVDKMTRIYYAVNHCNFATCRVLDSLCPMLLYYQIKVILGDSGAYTGPHQTPDFKRFTPGHAHFND